MSIVGPRPERPEIAAQYEKTIPEFSYRLKVKAGLTGYAQVYGKYNTKPYDKLKLDLTYIENYSFLLDLQLIATTVKVLFQKDNTEGVDQAQMTAADTQGETTDRRQLEKDVQNTVEEIRWQQQQSEMTKAPESLEQAAGLPSGVTAEEMAADQEPGLLVSVIMPVHNGMRTIGEAIESALNQDMHFESSQLIGRGSVQEMEILILDDGSTDGLEKLEEKYRDDPRVHFHHNEIRLGAAKSRNRGVLLARGKYVAFLDADDIWERDKLKKQFARIYETGSVLCCTGRALMRPDGSMTGRVIGVKRTISYRDLLWHNQINCSSVVLLTEVARQYPMIHEDAHEDYITWMKVLRDYGDAAGINEPLLRYRLSESGKSGKKLKSAAMTFRVYRYMGFGPVKSAFLFLSYAIHGVWKYRHP